MNVLAPVEYRGQLVALASPQRFHIVAPWLLRRPAGDPELRFVGYMCACYAEIAAGHLPGPFTSELAQRWARAALIDPARLAAVRGIHEQQLEREWRVPAHEIRIARSELVREG